MAHLKALHLMQGPLVKSCGQHFVWLPQRPTQSRSLSPLTEMCVKALFLPLFQPGEPGIPRLGELEERLKEANRLDSASLPFFLIPL